MTGFIIQMLAGITALSIVGAYALLIVAAITA